MEVGRWKSFGKERMNMGPSALDTSAFCLGGGVHEEEEEDGEERGERRGWGRVEFFNIYYGAHILKIN